MKLGLLTATMVLIATSAMAQHASHSSSNSETGQSQFAAIAEIVAMLRADPDTDWEQIDIGALRDHLVDMDNVTTKAIVETNANDLTVTFAVTGDATVAASIQRMVLAHHPMLQQTTSWSVMAEERSDGAMMQVQLKSMDEMNEVIALGFFGLMTIGAHHQQHHLMIAMGHSPH
ncbi:MAG: hypothetical protein JKY94_11605 [Rhodobacteraceae bacterium]|nr:hypothetical protein [Paracoccaceae bacterium]